MRVNNLVPNELMSPRSPSKCILEKCNFTLTGLEIDLMKRLEKEFHEKSI